MRLICKLMVFFIGYRKIVLDLSPIAPNIQLLLQFTKSQKEKLYLVGGSVRDLMLNRSITDLDFVVDKNAIGLAKKFAGSINGTFIQLETNPPTARVIHKQSQLVTIYDLAQFRGPDLATDLSRRDLTVNAMAYDLDRQIIIDPFGGQKDLRGQVVRFINRQSVIDDPLRMLRLFRLSAQLGFQIPTDSIDLVKSLSNHIKQSAIERIRDEFLKMLATNSSARILDQMQATGLLEHVLPVNCYKTISKRIHDFEVKPIPSLLADYLSQIDPSNNYFSRKVAGSFNRSTLTKLSLIAPLEQLKSLYLGRKVEKILKGWFSSDQFFPKLGEEPTVFLRQTKDEWLGIVARRFASITGPVTTCFDPIVLSIAACYYGKMRFIWQNGPLMTGRQLIENFGIQEGPKIGEILAYLENLQFSGSIENPQQAHEAVTKYLDH